MGDTKLRTAPLIFGGNVFGWTQRENASFESINAWLDAGFDRIDTADVYSIWAAGHRGGESEMMLGRYFAARGNCDRVIRTGKVGVAMGEGRRDAGFYGRSKTSRGDGEPTISTGISRIRTMRRYR